MRDGPRSVSGARPASLVPGLCPRQVTAGSLLLQVASCRSRGALTSHVSPLGSLCSALGIPVLICISAKLGGLLGACHLSHRAVRGRKQGVFPLLLSLLHKGSSAAPPGAGHAAGGALTSLKDSQGLLSDVKTHPSVRFLSPRWRFSLCSSSRSCLETSLVVAAVQEDVQLPFQLVDKSKLKPFPLVLCLPALLFLGGGKASACFPQSQPAAL